MECGIHSTDWKCSFQTAPLSVETVGLDAKTAPTTIRQIPNCTNYYEKPTVPLVVEQLVGAPLPTLVAAGSCRGLNKYHSTTMSAFRLGKMYRTGSGIFQNTYASG